MSQNAILETGNTVLKRNNVHTFGNGSRVMIFAHAFGCDQTTWRYITPAFENDFRIVLFDFVGSGASDFSTYNKEKYSSLQGYAQDLIEICEELGLRDAVFVGHSVGSMIGMLAAIEYPSFFSDLIMIGGSPRYINAEDYKGGFERSDIEELLATMEHNYIGWANFMAPTIMNRADRPEFGEDLTLSFRSSDPHTSYDFAKATFFSDNRKDLHKLKVPTLILQCSEDIVAPFEVGQYLHDRIPKNTFKLMKATGHCPHLSETEETIALIKDYLWAKT